MEAGDGMTKKRSLGERDLSSCTGRLSSPVSFVLLGILIRITKPSCSRNKQLGVR